MYQIFGTKKKTGDLHRIDIGFWIKTDYTVYGIHNGVAFFEGTAPGGIPGEMLRGPFRHLAFVIAPIQVEEECLVLVSLVLAPQKGRVV